MRIAIFSDIHGNSIGLDAVLADIEAKGGVNRYWVLGDHVAIGPDPVGVMNRLVALPNAEFIRGNGDRYVYSGERPPPHAEDLIDDPSLLPVLVEVEGNFAWTAGIMTEVGWMSWLEQLPFDISLTLPDGTTLWGIHSSPWRDNDEVGFCPKLTQDQIESYAAACHADITFCGHTHWPWDVRMGEKRIVNVGSVGNPNVPSLNACWTLISADETGYQLEQFEVPYDHQAIIDLTLEKNQPGSEFICNHYRGKFTRPWKREDRL